MKVLKFKISSALLFLIFSFSACEKFVELPYNPDSYDQPTDGLLSGNDSDEILTGSNVQGGYGNDQITGTDGDDFLDGGNGEDRVVGGPGNDLIVSRSDGREARVGRSFSAYRDPHGLIDPITKTLHKEQPIKGNDVLVGGPGGDTFRFITLVNAKKKIIENQTKNDGTIKWMKITLQNTYIHDHWVERIGNDIIEDFNKAEGDKIELVGHTATIPHIDHRDINNDGIKESILYVRSDQNAAGAHHKDYLGTITVFGDIVEKSDISKNNVPAIGIVAHIDDLEEAVSPRVWETDPEPDRIPD